MLEPSRRRFLQHVGAVSAAATVAVPAHARSLGSHERLTVGVIGCGGRGSGLLKTFRHNYPNNCDSGAEFYGTEGSLFVSKRGKLEVYGQRNRRIEDAKTTEPVQLTGNHQEDFLDAIRNGRRPRADIAIAHDSVALVHLANIATRLGRSLQMDAEREPLPGDDEATRLLSRQYRDGGHWAIPKGV